MLAIADILRIFFTLIRITTHACHCGYSANIFYPYPDYYPCLPLRIFCGYSLPLSGLLPMLAIADILRIFFTLIRITTHACHCGYSANILYPYPDYYPCLPLRIFCGYSLPLSGLLPMLAIADIPPHIRIFCNTPHVYENITRLGITTSELSNK